MKGEIPVFRRCCFCLPLRYGLLAWGYFKMIADLFLIVSMSFVFVSTLFWMRAGAVNKYTETQMCLELMIPMIAITLFFTDFIVTIVFIVGGHKKNVRLIRVFYFLSMGMWVATFLLASCIVISALHHTLAYHHHYMSLIHVLLTFCFYFIVLVVQTYVLLLLRSEIIKLRSSGEFRFVNNAAEAECTMRCDEVVVATEAVKTDN
ncbi:hypothetical protein PYW07_012071 [Mythimna separata]|uniref:Uncharacterized protein n=1 Tax=Mythimna separata TaxID=271217 RepID=A0AAD8DSA6_MYTSE|nr:hypothetical protein PYW07_012071 [Mythimna separata]